MKKLLKNSQFALFLLLVSDSYNILELLNRIFFISGEFICTGKNLCSSALICSCYYGDHDFRRTGYVVLYDRGIAAYATMYFLTSKDIMEVPLILIFCYVILIGVILQLFNWF